jgi:2-polyprenyl-3-methyl-5-hydroxy-6-metoxy-1,4-benzoquinol methylase
VTTSLDNEIEELVGRVFQAGIDALELYTVHLGQELGLYRALDDGGDQSAAELAKRTGLAHRYVREWLQSQAISGFVTIEGDDVDTGRYRLAPGVHETLLDETNPAYVGAIPAMLPTIGGVTSRLVDAFRTGNGVPYDAYGPRAVSIQAAMNRPAFQASLVNEWLPEIPGVLPRLQDTAHPARVADWCCGAGWSSITLAESFPHITVDGYDNDTESISRARRTAAERGVSDRVRFEVANISEAAMEDGYDVAFIFEAVHDLAHPVEALANCRKALKHGASLIVMDENAAEELHAPGDELERFLAAASVVWCTPQGQEPGSEVVGAIMRPHVLEDLARRAGFS